MSETISSTSLDEREVGKSRISYVIPIIAILYFSLLVYYTLRYPFSRQVLAVVFVGTILTVYYLEAVHDVLTQEESDKRRLALYSVMGLVAVLSCLYIFLEYNQLKSVRLGYKTNLDYVAGLAVLIPITHATFREYGLSFGSVLAFAFIYAYFGPYFPSFFSHSGFSAFDILSFSTVALSGGVFGSISGIIATWVAIFIFFAGFMQGFKGLDWIRNIGEYIGQFISSGPAQSAVLTSLGFGMVSGSGAANVAITGSFTIPLMKETQELPGKYAAAIESVASSGGQVMPPIMGAAAFLMADILGIPLKTVIIVALVPAVLFYVPLFISAHFLSVSHGQAKRVHTELRFQDIILQGIQYLIPLLALLYFLVIEQRTVMIAGVYSSFLMIAVGIIAEGYSNGVTLTAVRSVVTSIVDGAWEGMVTIARIGIIGAAIGIIVKVLTITAIAQRIALLLLDISAGSLFVLLLLTMGMAILLGMGAPPVAAYLITALLLAPAIIEFGIPSLQAHFLVFYFSILSYITPPIAIGVAIASNIAKADFLESALEAVKLGLPLYILPFLFVYLNLIPADGIITPGLLLRAGVALLGLCVLVYGVTSHLGNRIYRTGTIATAVLVLVGGSLYL